MNIVLIISYLSLGVAVVSTAVVGFCWREYYVIYHVNLLYVIGLVFSRSLTNYTVVGVLMWYFTYYKGDLVMSAVLSNIQQALSSILVTVMAHMADSFFGRYPTLLFSNTAYIGGLWLMWMFNPYDVTWLVVILLVLLAFGTSGTNLVNNVLTDLVKDIDNSQDEEQSNARAAFWCNIAEVSGAVSATMWVANDSIGGNNNKYTQSHQNGARGNRMRRVISLRDSPVGEISCLEVTDESSVHDFETPSREEETQEDRASHTLRNEPSLHDLDLTTGEEERQEDRASNSPEHDKQVLKSLLRIFPVWAAFFMVSLISATGSTFFFEQYNNLSNSKNIPIQIYNLLQQGSSFAIPFLYRWTTCSHKNEKVKIGVGMLFSIICCLIAWQLEVVRLNEVRHLDYESTTTSISFLWLLPQFCVLGCMEGLTKDGLLRFFKSQINDRNLESYGEEYIELVLGFGKLLNIALILICKSKLGWFSYTINDSQLDKYYRILLYACSANFVYYCVIASFWFKNAEETEDTVSDDSEQLLEP
ncbi:putative proton-dependent oligopeptide transporter family protein [Tanacetum coccineum]